MNVPEKEFFLYCCSTEALNKHKAPSSLTYVPKILSGIDVIDTTWGGLYQGGSYLCYGHASSGRGLLGMLFLKTGALLDEKGLFISPGRPQDWFIQASSVQFDLDAARQAGAVRSIWIPSFVSTQKASDAGGAQVIDDLVRIIQREDPERVVINDFAPFLQFHSFERFREAFAFMVDRLEEVDATVMIMMPEAANTASRQIIDFMGNHMTGSVHISITDGREGKDRRQLTLLPGMGHVERASIDGWDILPGGQVRGASRKAMTLNTTSSKARANKDASSGISVAPMVALSLQDVAISHEGFVHKLEDLFRRRALKGDTSFLLVALRVEADQEDFDIAVVLRRLVPVIESIVDEPGDLLLDVERRRIVALLSDADASGVQSFFEMIQKKLSQDHPDMAARLPHVVSAVVVPNGQPFESPQDFLAYALEGR